MELPLRDVTFYYLLTLQNVKRQTAITVGNVNGHWWLNRQQELLWEVLVWVRSPIVPLVSLCNWKSGWAERHEGKLKIPGGHTATAERSMGHF